MSEIKREDSNKITEDYFESILLESRYIDAGLPSTEIELYGKKFATPVMSAALSHLENTRQNGAAEMAEGTKAAGAVNWTGMGPIEELQAILKENEYSIKIVKPTKDNDVVLKEIEEAERAGAFALGMDIDHPFDKSGRLDIVHGTVMAPKSREELKGFIKATKLPFILKGVLSERDAEKALEVGAKGIVVSHHHGILNYAVPPLMVLPKITKVVGGKIPIFVDCGVRSGYDVFKALALGATAVSVGRELMPPLREAGAAGVEKAVTDITSELASAMAKTGYTALGDIDDSCIWYRNF